MRIRRTPKELAEFRKIVAYEMAQGYPRHAAESRAWDSFHVQRQVKRGTFRSKVNS